MRREYIDSMLHRMPAWVCAGWQRLGHMGGAWPSQCLVCRAWPAQPLCMACWQRFWQPAHRCQACALRLPLLQGQQPALPLCGACLRQPTGLAACVAAVDYAYPWSGLLARWKFQQTPGLTAEIARWLQAADGTATLLAQADVVLPVPLSSARLRARGYNQAALLARALAPGQTREGWLLRLQDTAQQSRLGRAQRLRNLGQALAVDPLQAPALRGRSVLLVDDILTTGATLQAAAQVLQRAGVQRVTALVAARTPAPGTAAP